MMDIGNFVSKSWQLFKQNKKMMLTLIGIEVGLLILSVIFEAGIFGGEKAPSWYKLISSVIEYLVTFVNIKAALAVLDGTPVLWSEFSGHLWERFPQYFWSVFLAGLVVFAGFFLLVIPGIIWGLDYALVPYLAVRKQLGARETLSESKRMMKGNRLNLLAMGLILGLVNLGVLLLMGLSMALSPVIGLGFGLVLSITMTVSGIAMALFYREVSEKDMAAATVVTPQTDPVALS